MKVEVKRITDPNLFREVAEMTTGKECKMSWNLALCSGHSIIRAEEYLIKLYDIPQCVMGHLVRHTHSQPYVLSKRPDRGGEDMTVVCGDYADIIRQQADYLDGCEDWDKKSLVEMAEIIQQHLMEYSEYVRQLPDRFGRMAPTNMALKLNAEEIINISKVRLCSMASEETRSVWKAVVEEIRKVDTDLARHCQPTCIYRCGICPEPKSCGFNKTDLFKKQLHNYKLNFVL